MVPSSIYSNVRVFICVAIVLFSLAQKQEKYFFNGPAGLKIPALIYLSLG